MTVTEVLVSEIQISEGRVDILTSEFDLFLSVKY